MSSSQFIVFIILTCLETYIAHMNGQKLTKFCIHIIIDKIYVWDSKL